MGWLQNLDTPWSRGLSFRDWLTARKLEREFDHKRWMDGGAIYPQDPPEGWSWTDEQEGD